MCWDGGRQLRLGVHIQKEGKNILEQEWGFLNWINWQFLSRDSCGITVVYTAKWRTYVDNRNGSLFEWFIGCTPLHSPSRVTTGLGYHLWRKLWYGDWICRFRLSRLANMMAEAAGYHRVSALSHWKRREDTDRPVMSLRLNLECVTTTAHWNYDLQHWP